MRTTHALRRPLLLLGILFSAISLLALAGCGGSMGHAIPRPSPIGTFAATPPATGTPGVSRYAYLYSRVDYPLQIPVNADDTVTLTLSPHSNILTVAPAAGSGAATVGEPIPLPTDLQDYTDIGATVSTVDAQAAPTEPVTWSLTSAPRQSLLAQPTSDGQRTYRNVRFQWQIHAGAAGANTVEITLGLYYDYLDGSEHEGTIQVSQAPIPVVAVIPTALNTSLPPLRLPIAGITGLAGILAILRFFWSAYRTVKDVVEPVRDVATAAQAVHARISRDGQPSSSAAPMAHPVTQRTVGSPPQADGRHLWPPRSQ